MVDFRIGRRLLLLGAVACTGAKRAAASPIPIDTADGRCVVSILLDGRPARMVLDTGLDRTLVTSAAAWRLGLRRDPWVDTTIRGAGGQLETRPNVDVGEGMIGGIRLTQMIPGGGLNLSVADLDLGDADGLLGGDILRHFTLDLDAPRSLLLLLPPGQRPFFNTAPVPLQRWASDLLLAPVKLDGRSLTALIDTGATSSLINARGLYRLGLPASQLRRDPEIVSAGIGGAFPAHIHRFAELQLGEISLSYPNLVAAAVPEAGYDIILGMDVLGRQRLILSYAALKLRFA